MGGAALEAMYFNSQSSCASRIFAKLAFIAHTAECPAALRSLPLS